MNAIDIFKNASFNEGEVEIKSWSDAPIKIRELNAKQATAVVGLVETDPLRSNAKAVAYGCIADDGKRIFTDGQVDKILEKIRVSDITKIATAIMNLSEVVDLAEK